MRIALVHYSAPPVIGGVERVIGEQQAVLRRMGHEVELVCGQAAEVLLRLGTKDASSITGDPGPLAQNRGPRTPRPSAGTADASSARSPYPTFSPEDIPALLAKLNYDPTSRTPDGSTPFLRPQDKIRKHTYVLPHWEQQGVIYSLTWRLDDSLPQPLLQQLKQDREAWIEHHPKPWSAEVENEYHDRFHSRLEEWLDAQHGSCVLRDPAVGDIVAKVLLGKEGVDYQMITFALMPNHVHVVFRLRTGVLLEEVVKAWKGVSAKLVNKHLGRTGTLWRERYWHRIVRSPEHLANVYRYVLENPMKAKLGAQGWRVWTCLADAVSTSSENGPGVLSPHNWTRGPRSPELDQGSSVPTFDLVIVHNIFTMPFDLALTRGLRDLAALSTSTKWINWVHDVAAVNPNYAHLAWESEELQMLKKAPPNCTHVAVSEIRQIEYCGLTQVPLEECRVIPNGVEVAKVLNLSPRIVDLIEPLRLWERDFVLVHPTRILRRKNIELGLRVVKALRKDSLDVAYLISGASDPHNPDGAAYGRELRALVEELSLQDSALFLGDDGPLSDDDVRSLYAVSDALLFPSKSEGFGLPLVEAALHGLPVFCSDIGAHREIGQSVGNFFFLDEDPALIARAIASHPGVEARYIRRITLAAWLDWNKIAVTYLEPLLHDVCIS